MAPTFPPRFVMIILLQPKHCTPAQHEPITLKNELPIAEALSNNSPSCLRSILASACTCPTTSKESNRNSSATTPWHESLLGIFDRATHGLQAQDHHKQSFKLLEIRLAPQTLQHNLDRSCERLGTYQKLRNPRKKHCSKKWYCKKSVSLTRILLQNIVEKNKMKHP